MTTVDELFDRYRAAYRAGASADPRPYLERLSGVDRRELAALIDAFLAQDAGRADDEHALERLREDPLAERIRAAAAARLAEREDWRTLLKGARDQAGISRATLVRRLAQTLGVGDREQKVAGYYHRMETGRLPARGVTERVLQALSGILGVPVDRLRAAGERLPPPAPGGPAAVFARSASASAAAETPMAAGDTGTWDEVDDLFTGGG